MILFRAFVRKLTGPPRSWIGRIVREQLALEAEQRVNARLAAAYQSGQSLNQPFISDDAAFLDLVVAGGAPGFGYASYISPDARSIYVSAFGEVDVTGIMISRARLS